MNDNFDIWTVVHVLSTAAIFFITFYAIKVRLKEQEKREQKLRLEMEHSEAEELSRKMRDFRVEMGLRKPHVFDTKRKPQNPRKPLDKKG